MRPCNHDGLMKSIKLQTHISEDGVLQLHVPTELANSDVEVTIVPRSPSAQQTSPEELGYSPEFINTVLGGWEGEPLARPEQPPYQEREEIQWPTS